MDSITQHRYIVLFYHAGQVTDKWYGEKWFDRLEDCEKEAESLDIDSCGCGIEILYESRLVPRQQEDDPTSC